ncbi:MAG: hypothetical protein VKK42_30455 [Lyngbya sp.]|nr:hypothetical protein [Lyngbya sp.]
MTRQQIGRINHQSKGETPLVSGVLQRAAVRAVADKKEEGTQQVESGGLNPSRFVHDFSQVPIDRELLRTEKLRNQTSTNSLSRKVTQQIIQLNGKGKKSKHDRQRGRLAKDLGVERTIPLEEEKPYSLSFESKTINPYTPAEVEAILVKITPGQLFDVDPHRLRTMHAGISDKFSDSSTIADTVEALKTDPSAINHVPPIFVAAIEQRIFEPESSETVGHKGKKLMLFTEDHRRVVAAREAGISRMKAQMKADPSVIGNYTTKNLGMSVEVRTYRKTGEGAHQRGNKSTFPGSGKVYKYKDVEEDDI